MPFLKNSRNLAIILFLASFVCIGVRADEPKTNATEHYDEVRNADGSIRLQYDGIYEIYNKLSPQKKSQLEFQSKRLFKFDNSLHLLPRILTEGEMATLSAGVIQRATALKMFFEDHYSGKKAYLSQKILPERLITQIIERHGDGDWAGKIVPSMLNWVYGPDIVRLPDGRFAVVEDNFGYVGGMGDLEKAPDALFKVIPQYKKILEKPDPGVFYRNLVKRYQEHAKKFGGKVVLVQYSPREFADNEDHRIRAIFKKLGVDFVSVSSFGKHEYNFSKSPTGDNYKRLEIREDGVFLKKKSAKKGWTEEKVGFIISNADILDLDGTSIAGRKRRLLLAAKAYLEQQTEKDAPVNTDIRNIVLRNSLGEPIDLNQLQSLLTEHHPHNPYTTSEKMGVAGLHEAILSGKVGSNYSPGLNFVEDKEFYASVPHLIEFYLKEEPILQTLKTGSFRSFNSKGTPVLNEAALEQVFSNLDRYVIKGVAGMGGKEVWIGPKMKTGELATLQAKVKANPSLFIFQDYLPLSVMEGSLVDLRLLSDVGPKLGDVLVAEAPWGRSVSLSGDGKVNISANGNETTVLIRKSSSIPCIKSVIPASAH